MTRNNAIWIALGGIAVISLAIVLGPLFSPDEYSWRRHTTSEQAGQYLPGAWIMRTGFVAYGLGLLGAALLDRKTRPWVRAALVLFGSGLIATAIWSNASILENAPSDMREDWLHSLASGIVGLAFSAACAARLFAPGGNRTDILAWTGLLISVLFPLAMGAFPDIRGLIQRSLFAFSFVFVLREFL